MVEEFRATRAFLREVLVFTDASAIHIQRVMDVQSQLELVLSAAPASVESQMGWGGVDMYATRATPPCSALLAQFLACYVCSREECVAFHRRVHGSL
jgi:hypothetical protein